MRILFFLRFDASLIAGGDAIEARVLAGGLAALGHDALVVSSLAAPAGSWDVVHLFNIDRAAELGTFLDANRSFPGAKVVMSPLYSWRNDDAAAPEGGAGPGSQDRVSRSMKAARSVVNLARASARPTRQWRPGAAVAQLAARADGLVFHTAAEERAFLGAYPEFSQRSAVIVPPLETVAADPAVAVRLQAFRPYVACVGRIEPLKNQRWLLRCAMPPDLDLVFAGAVNPKRPLYAAGFERDVRRWGRHRWLGALERAGVAAVLENAVAHVLPSRAENFGLATLEALGVGCEAVIPAGHPAVTVLGDSVHVFDLRSPDSLAAPLRAIRTGSKRASRFRGDDYAPACVVSRLLSFYDEVRS
jgi:glycosyltransferase involved in cell wall biosynthesis